MEKKVTRIKKSNTYVPVFRNQVNDLLSKLGKTQDAINEIEKGLSVKIAELKAEALKKLQPLTLERDGQMNSLFAFANPRKAELTKNTRSIVLRSGTFGWRLTTPRVELSQSDAETIALLKRIGKDEFVRIIEEVDRQALLAERPVVKGIAYVQDDEFFVVPRQICKKPKTLTKAIDR